MTLKDIKTKCTDELLQYCLFESVHENKVIPVITYYKLHRLSEVDRLFTCIQSKNLNTYIQVLDKLTNQLISILD